MKIVIEYDEETGHACRAWVFDDPALASLFFAYARNTARLDCDMTDAEDPARQLLDWLLARRPTEDEEEAFRYWHEGAPPGRGVETIHLPPTLEEQAERAKADRDATLGYLGKAMGLKDGDPGDPVHG